jgi:hypothetical protein
MSALPEAQKLNIDEVNIEDILHYPWAPMLIRDLEKECKRIWKRRYSSFAASKETAQPSPSLDKLPSLAVG